MELEDIILTGTLKEQKTIKIILTEAIPLGCIHPLTDEGALPGYKNKKGTIMESALDNDEDSNDENDEIKNLFYASLHQIDHGSKVEIVPRYKLEGIHIETDALEDIQGAPKSGSGEKRGYCIWFTQDGFLIENPMNITQLLIHYK